MINSFKISLMSIVILLIATAAFAQPADKISDWVRTQGVVTDVKFRPDLSSVELKLKIDVTIKNIRDKPVFIYEKAPVLHYQAVALSLEDANNYKYALKVSWGGVSRYGTDESLEEIKLLDQKNVPKDKFLVLDPSEEKMFQFDASVEFEKRPTNGYDKKWSEISRKCGIWLKVGMGVWRESLLESLDKNFGKFGKKLQKRWQGEGYLALDYLITEPMKLILPKDTGCE